MYNILPYQSSYFWVIVGAVICILADVYVKSTFNKFKSVSSRVGMTGYEVAYKILKDNDLTYISIERSSGDALNNYYDPSKQVVRLSDTIYDKATIASAAIAAHECGHVLQHERGYLPMRVRAVVLPLAQLGSKMGLPMVIIGLVLGGGYRYFEAFASRGNMLAAIGSLLITVGIWVFGIAVAFQVLTLPIEFNASSRGLAILKNSEMLKEDELVGGAKILRAAALTYVAAAASSILQLLRVLAISRGGRRRR